MGAVEVYSIANKHGSVISRYLHGNAGHLAVIIRHFGWQLQGLHCLMLRCSDQYHGFDTKYGLMVVFLYRDLRRIQEFLHWGVLDSSGRIRGRFDRPPAGATIICHHRSDWVDHYIQAISKHLRRVSVPWGATVVQTRYAM